MMTPYNVIQLVTKVSCPVYILTASIFISGCNDGSSTTHPGDEQGNGYQGRLYYHEGRYGEEKVGTYLGLELSSLSSTPISTDSGAEFSISRDGHQFLMVDPSLTIIHVYDKNGVLIGSIDLGKTVVGIPRFSPDRKYIAVQFRDNYAHNYLAILTATGKPVNVVDIHEDGTERRGVEGLDWSPEGQVFYTAYGKIYKLKDINSDEVELVKSFESEFDVFNVRVSPDGSKLAVLANESYTSKIEGDIYVLKNDGSEVKEVVKVTGEVRSFTNPAWSPNSRYIASEYAENWGGSSCGVIWIFDTWADSVAEVSDDTSASEVEGAYEISTADYEVHGLCAKKGLDWY